MRHLFEKAFVVQVFRCKAVMSFFHIYDKALRFKNNFDEKNVPLAFTFSPTQPRTTTMARKTKKLDLTQKQQKQTTKTNDKQQIRGENTACLQKNKRRQRPRTKTNHGPSTVHLLPTYCTRTVRLLYTYCPPTAHLLYT